MVRSSAVACVLVVATSLLVTTHTGIVAQAGGDQTVTLEQVGGKPTGTLRLPAAPARPPVVLLLAESATEAAALATALAADGVASLRMDGNMITTETTAQWIAFLRNDARFPTVSVFGDAGDHSLYTLPSPDRFQLIVSRDVGQFHTVHEESLFLGRVDMAPGTRSASVEGLTFAIAATGSAGTLKLIWDTREYATSVTNR